MNSKFFFITIFLSIVVLSCTVNNRNREVQKDNFFLDFRDENIHIRGDNISLSSVFRAPDLFAGSDEKESWEHKEHSESAMTFAGEKGILRIDIFTSNNGKLERKTWLSDRNDLVAFQHIYFNSSNKEVKLNALYPFSISGKQSLFNKVSKYRILTQKTMKNGSPSVVFPQKEMTYTNPLLSNDLMETDKFYTGKVINSDPFLIINDSLENNNLFIGSQSYYLHLFELNIEFIEQGGAQLIESLESKCNFEGITVPVNAFKESQWIVLSQGKDPNKLIADYTERTSKLQGIKKPKDAPPSVYCEFYYYGLGYNEDYFKNDIAVFQKDPLPFDVFQIDACWQQNYGHDFEVDRSVFPSGMKWAADQIRSLGYIPGIWTAPYIVRINWSNPETDLKKNHPEWLLKNSKGEFVTWIDHYYILDTTYPGVTDYLENSYRKLAKDWGYEYFKFDFMRTIFLDADQQFYDKTITSLEAYRKGLEAIKRGVGEDAYISVCGGHYGASYGIANSQRSGSDTRSIWDINEIRKYRQNILRTWMSNYWHVDADAMGIRRQETALLGTNDKSLGMLSDEEAATNTLNQFIGGGMVCFAEDFANIDEDRKALYRHVIPSINSPSKPIDIFDPLCPSLLLTHVKPICKDLPEWVMLSVVNWSNNPKSFEIKLDDKILNSIQGNKYVVFEFFSQKVIGVFDKNQTIIIENQRPHQSQLFRIIKWDGKEPVLAGTDLHFSGGGVEIKEWKVKKGKLTGTIDTPWNYPVKVTIVLPATKTQGFKIETITIAKEHKAFAWQL